MKRLFAREKKAIESHYDVSNDFYRLFLGELMVYSCAYFRRPQNGLNQAQADKLAYICKKLRLKPGESLLDIGCGWGGLVIWAARHFGVKAHGITLSRNQFDYAQEWIKREKIEHLCRVELKNYREIAGEKIFDKIVSVGMFEHVGIKNLPVYFKTVGKLLKEKGLFLNHGITREINQRGSSGTKFINKYVFPGGELTNISRVMQEMEKTGFEILDVESLRPHYAKTLHCWTDNLQSQKERALKMVSERIYRTWELYMAGCSYSFEKGNVNVYQVLASNQNEPGLPKVPMSREDLY
jgi:cyclopropane-fatty-acyl-phospholipid synthase